MFGIFKGKSETLTVRRGTEILGKVQEKNIVPIIKNKKFFGSDRISKDGKKWLRLDKTSKYKKYFSSEPAMKMNFGKLDQSPKYIMVSAFAVASMASGIMSLSI
jgi:hypothetical protein